MCEEELLSLIQASLRVHKNKSRCQFRTGASSQVLHPQPSTALALELCCQHGKSKEKLCTFISQFCLKNNWAHMVLPHLFFTVNITSPCPWPCLATGILFSPPTRAPLAAPFRRSLLTGILQGPLPCLLQGNLHPCSWHKAQPDPGPRAGSNTGPSAAPGWLVWVKVCEREVLNKNSLLSLLLPPLPS